MANKAQKQSTVGRPSGARPVGRHPLKSSRLAVPKDKAPSAFLDTTLMKSIKPGKLQGVMLIAEAKGLLSGVKDTIIRGRMPEALVQNAKARTGIQSDTELLEVALANLAVADDFPEWLLSRRGKVSSEIDLEF